MIQLQNVHSLTDFQRNTSKHVTHLHKTGLPSVLTVNGKAELVVQSATAYQAMLDKLDLLESARQINKGLQSVCEGKASSFKHLADELRAEIGQE